MTPTDPTIILVLAGIATVFLIAAALLEWAATHDDRVGRAVVRLIEWILR